MGAGLGAAMILGLIAGHASALPAAAEASMAAAPEPQMFASSGYAPPVSSFEGTSDGEAGLFRRSKSDYTPPVDIFGKSPYGPFSKVAFGLTANTLGGGAEIATPLGNGFNLRVGANFIQFQYPFSKDGLDYTPQIKLESAQGTIDWFPGNGDFHVSAGALYFKNDLSGPASVQVGQTFTLGSATYLNSIDDPVSGTAAVTYSRKIAPLVLIGFGNLLPRTGRRLSFPLEAGVAYMGAPQTRLILKGTSCTSDGCFDAGTDAGMQSNIKLEQTKISNDLSYTTFYPVLSFGVAFRF